MRLGISGTYSSGKTITGMALSHYTGIPRTKAKTMREILPDAAPGKTLDECTAAELLQMVVVRHVDRAVHENRLWGGFISDGSSLQEWIYGSVRVTVGINPNDSVHLSDLEAVEKTPELAFFEDVMSELGKAFKRHVKGTFDAFVHLPNELPLAEDGHRPVNERFRSMSDEHLMKTLAELEIPFHVVGGTLPERLARIAEIFDLPVVRDVDEAIRLASEEYAAMDVRDETERATVPAQERRTPDAQSPAQLIRELLVQKYGVFDGDLDTDATFESLEVDSLVLIELAVVLERRFAVRVPDHELVPELTLGEAAALVESKRLAKT
jgi:acyl carrier protein